MGNKKEVTVAIVATVTAFLKAQEEEAEQQRPLNFSRRNSLWGLAGRQEIMSQRQLWQLKIFNGNHLQRSAFLKTGLDPMFFKTKTHKPAGKIPVLLGTKE